MSDSSPATVPAAAGTEGHQSLARATTSGVVWLMIQSVGTRFIGFGSQLALAWFLSPADFGMIGLAYTVTALIGTLVNFGLDEVLLQRQRSLQLWSGTAVWVSFGLGMIGMAILLIAAPISSHLYHVPRLTALIAIMAIAMPIGALVTVPAITLRAALNFRFLATWGTFDLLGTQLLTVLLAWLGFGAYSFAVPVPVMAAVRVLVFWSKARPKLQTRLRLKQVSYLISNGSIVFGTRLITELVGQGDYITLGIMASPSAVGAYFFAFRLSAQPVRVLAGNLQNVMLPALVKLRYDSYRQGIAALNAARILAYIVMPFCFLQAAIADPLLHLLFGDKWVDAIPLVQILSIGLPFDAVSWIAGALLHARGDFRRSFTYSVLAAPIFFASVALGAWQGSATGVAVAVALFYAVVPLIYSWRVFLQSGIGTQRVARVYLLPTLLSAVTMGIAYAISFGSFWAHSSLLRMSIIGVAGPAIYISAVFFLDPATFSEILLRFGLRRLRQLISAAPR